MTDQFSAANSTGRTDTLLPTIVIDTREQSPLTFTRLPAITGTLSTGDYSIAGLETLFAVERKSVTDLIGSVTQGRERFERELARLRGYHFRRLLVIGTRDEVALGEYRSRANPKAILASVDAFEARYDLPVVWAASPAEGAGLIERWAYYFAREVGKRAEALRKAGSRALQPQAN